MTKKYEVVVSGISGKFPECDGLPDFKKYLNSKTNLVTVNDKKWKHGTMKIPDATGKVKNPNELDNKFFGVSPRLMEVLDRRCTMCLKTAFEAVIDAGICPAELSDSNTAVVIGSAASDTEFTIAYNELPTNYAMLGTSRAMHSNWVSYALNLKGTSITVDGAWADGIFALAMAHNLISEGRAAAAIVGTNNFLLFPTTSVGYAQLGSLTYGDKTKSFCDDADGYNRSDGIVIMVLQRAEDARRSYGSIVDVLVENNGSRPGRLIDFSPDDYKNILKRVYINSKVDMSKLAYVELDGCGIKGIDAAELDSIAEVLCSSRKDPLLVGSVKSNIGHCETASGSMSVVKALIALDSGVIPPNMYYSSPNSKSEALLNGKLKVVTEPTDLPGDLVGVSSIGFVGTYGHVILRQNPKSKPKTRSDNLPRLIIVQGGDEELTIDVLKKIKNMNIDEEYVALLHQVYKRHVSKMYILGYTILGDGYDKNPKVKHYQVGVRRPVWFVFSGMGSQWLGMGKDLLRLPIFARAIHNCHKVLEPKGIDIIDIITNKDPSTFDSILNSFVGIAAIQIGLVDVLRALDIKPDGLVGHSVGELGCAYADGCLTAEQTVLCAYARGRASIETNLINGRMAAVGLGYEEIKNKIPEAIDVACHNSASSCTLSGPDEEVSTYLDKLKREGVFVKLVNVGNIAYHSRYIEPAAPTLLKYLSEVIPDPKPRSPLWISSSVPESQRESQLFKYCSAEYHTNNFLCPVLFEEASRHIPKGAVIVEIAPHGLLQAILRRSHSECVNIRLTDRTQKDGILCLLDALGNLYLEGVEMDLSNIYPKVEFPVSRGTHAIHNLVPWKLTTDFKNLFARRPQVSTATIISFRAPQEKWKVYFERKICDRLILPSSTFLSLAVENFNKLRDSTTFIKPVEFQNFNILKQVEMNPSYATDIEIQITKGTGSFEFHDGAVTLARGSIANVEAQDIRYCDTDTVRLEYEIERLNESEFYMFMETMGFENLRDSFRNVKDVTVYDNGVSGKVLWRGEWMLFLDALFQLVSFYCSTKHGKLRLVESVRQITIDPSLLGPDHEEVEVLFHESCQILRCGGLQFTGISTSPYEPTPNDRKSNKLLAYQFVPISNPAINDAYYALTVCANLLLQDVREADSGPPIKVTLINTQREQNYFNIFYDILFRQENVKINVIDVSRMDSFQVGDLEELTDKSCCIVAANEIGQTAKCLLGDIEKGFLLIFSPVKSDESNKMEIVFDYKTENCSINLLKKIPSLGFDHDTICMTEDNWETKLSWKLKEFEQDKRSSLVYVFGVLVDVMSMWEIVGLHKDTTGYHRLRYFFLDSHCPPFSPEDPFYSCQLKKDLKLNVCKRGVWGSVILVPLSSETVVEPVLPPTAQRVEGIDLKCLGIKLRDELRDSTITNRELDVVDYSGIAAEGREIFGMCSLTAYGTLVPDPVLSWDKPPTWSHEEAATVPLLYSAAYHMLLDIPNIIQNTTLFVNDGLSALSQAIITSASDLGFEIYTTYNNEDEKMKLRASFPQVRERNMVCHKSNDYRYALHNLTHSHGIDVVINTLEGKWHFDVTKQIVSFDGTFIQLAQGLLRSDESIGMAFFRGHSLYSFDVNNLSQLSEAKKIVIQKLIKGGLERGTTKPLPFKIITNTQPASHSINALSLEEVNRTKLVLKVTETVENKKRRLFSNRSDSAYLIVGTRRDLWIHLIDWLTLRGAKNIFILIDKQSEKNNSYRLRCIRNIYPDVTINFLHSDSMSSEPDAISCLNDVVLKCQLVATFVLDMETEAHLNHLEKAIRTMAPNSEFICFGVGKRLCNARQKQGLQALFIYFPHGRKRVETILPHVDGLISKERKFSYVYVSEYDELNFPGLDARRPLLKYGYLPRNLNELEDLGRELSGTACFEEVTSLCPRWGITREVPPVFLLPGLRAGLMDRLAASLSYPLFKAKLPASINNLETVALELVEAASKFELSALTIVASDWCCALAFHMAQHLTNSGKAVSLVLLDGHAPIENCAIRFLRNNCSRLIRKYFKIPLNHLQTQFCSDRDWDASIDALIADCQFKNPTRRECVINGLNALKARLENILTFCPREKLTCTNVLKIRPNGSRNRKGLPSFQQLLPDSTEETVTNDVEFEDIFNNPEVAKIINEAVLIERKDAAIDRTLKKETAVWPYLMGHQ